MIDNEPVAQNLTEAISGANVVLFLTNHLQYRGMSAEFLIQHTARPLLVVDAWHNVASPEALLAVDGVQCMRIGDGLACTPS